MSTFTIKTSVIFLKANGEPVEVTQKQINKVRQLLWCDQNGNWDNEEASKENRPPNNQKQNNSIDVNYLDDDVDDVFDDYLMDNNETKAMNVITKKRSIHCDWIDTDVANKKMKKQ